MAVAAGAFVLGAPAGAQADQTLTAQTAFKFSPAMVTLMPGERLTFANDDSVSPGPHNVTADQDGPDGKPLFASATIAKGKTSEVAGVAGLAPGTYAFHCTVHPFMKGAIEVSSAPAPAAPAADTTAPQVSARIASGSVRSVRHARAIAVRLATDGRAALRIALTARSGGHRITIARASRQSPDAAGRSSYVVPLTKAGRSALRHARGGLSVTLTVRAVDAAGNATKVVARRTLR